MCLCRWFSNSSCVHKSEEVQRGSAWGLLLPPTGNGPILGVFVPTCMCMTEVSLFNVHRRSSTLRSTPAAAPAVRSRPIVKVAHPMTTKATVALNTRTKKTVKSCHFSAVSTSTESLYWRVLQKLVLAFAAKQKLSNSMIFLYSLLLQKKTT